MISAFGLDHGYISKAGELSKERAKPQEVWGRKVPGTGGTGPTHAMREQHKADLYNTRSNRSRGPRSEPPPRSRRYQPPPRWNPQPFHADFSDVPTPSRKISRKEAMLAGGGLGVAGAAMAAPAVVKEVQDRKKRRARKSART